VDALDLSRDTAEAGGRPRRVVAWVRMVAEKNSLRPYQLLTPECP
jgi:hypothetical protein